MQYSLQEIQQLAAENPVPQFVQNIIGINPFTRALSASKFRGRLLRVEETREYVVPRLNEYRNLLVSTDYHIKLLRGKPHTGIWWSIHNFQIQHRTTYLREMAFNHVCFRLTGFTLGDYWIYQLNKELHNHKMKPWFKTEPYWNDMANYLVYLNDCYRSDKTCPQSKAMMKFFYLAKKFMVKDLEELRQDLIHLDWGYVPAILSEKHS